VNQLVASNVLLQDRADSLRTLLNSGHVLRLFQNNFTPVSQDSFGSFSEASFTGYASAALTADFGASFKVQDGEYQISSTFHTFTCTGGSPQTVYGSYISAGSDWKFAIRFDVPIVVTNGTSFAIQINPQDWAKSIIP
jgi:hypothetical protein